MNDYLERRFMRITVELDEILLEKAQNLTGVMEKSALIHLALKTLIERESARRLASLGGSQLQLSTPSRRRQGI
jgi:Arc/MetJ family transcription regulator